MKGKVYCDMIGTSCKNMPSQKKKKGVRGCGLKGRVKGWYGVLWYDRYLVQEHALAEKETCCYKRSVIGHLYIVGHMMMKIVVEHVWLRRVGR